MKKLILSAAVLCMAALFASAQTAKSTAKWEAQLNKNLQKRDGVYGLYLGEDAKSYYLLAYAYEKRAWTPKMRIEKYDKTKLSSTGTKILTDFDKIVKKAYVVGNATYASACENWGVTEKKKQVPLKFGVYRFNKSMQTFESIMSELGGDKGDSFEELYISPDKSKLLFVFKSENETEPKNTKYRLLATDVKLKKLWEKTIAKEIADFAIANDGAAYITYPTIVDGKKTGEQILAKVNEAEKPKGFKVNMNNYFYNHCRVIVKPDNSVAVVGYYTDKADVYHTGMYYFSVNDAFSKAENLKYNRIVQEKTKKEAEKEVKKEEKAKKSGKYEAYYNRSEKPGDEKTQGKYEAYYEKKNDAGIDKYYENIQFGKPIYGKDGQIAICAEKVSVEIIQKSSTNSSGMTSIYNSEEGSFGEINVFKIVGDTLAWIKRVPKGQFSSQVVLSKDFNDRYMSIMPYGMSKYIYALSYQAVFSGDNVVLIFNDEKDNMQSNENTDMDKSTSFKAFVWGFDVELVQVTLDKNGKQSKAIIPTPALQDDNLLTEVKNAHFISDSQVFVSARYVRNFKNISKVGILTIK